MTLPFPTDFDDSDLAGMGADPMGTLAGAERLADRILPAMMARMWRPRYLTFAVIAGQVSRHVATESDREAILVDARMAFERLFVSALVRKDGEEAWDAALGGLQGRRLAKRAYLEGKGVFEMREHFGLGWRMYYIQRGAVLIVMLGGGGKSTQSADIAKAVKLAAYFQG